MASSAILVAAQGFGWLGARHLPGVHGTPAAALMLLVYLVVAGEVELSCQPGFLSCGNGFGFFFAFDASEISAIPVAIH